MKKKIERLIEVRGKTRLSRPCFNDNNFNFITVQNVYMIFANGSLYSSESVGNVICSKFDNTFTNNRPEELL